MAGPQRLTEGSDNWSGFLGFDDYVLGLGGADTMNGAGGNDRLYGGAGRDTIRGGDGNDILDGGDDLQLVATDSDNSSDFLFGEGGNDTLRGKAGDDQLFGGDGNDRLFGGIGHDVLDGGLGSDDLFGEAGNDLLVATSTRAPGSPLFAAASFADIGSGRDAGGTLDGGADNDTIMTSHDFTGTMTVVGGTGTDTLILSQALDTYAWSNPNAFTNTIDLLTGTGTTAFGSQLTVSGIENIDGDIYSDVFRGNNEANVLRGFGGSDRLTGRGGADTLDGGAGLDIADYSDSLAGGVNVDLTRATQLGADAQGDVLISIEDVHGTVFADTLRGNSAINILRGNGGDDRLEGRGGADVINGGSGIDTASYESSSAAVWVSLDEPATDAAALAAGGDATGDALISIENLVGSAFADALTGNSLANTLEGGGGADNLNGGGGDDTLLGGDGNDTIFGGQQSDLIDGGFGNDTLNGDRDVDTVSFESWDPTGIFTPFGETIRIVLGEGTASGTATRTLSVNGVSSVVETDTLSGFENVRGSNRAETITGNSGVNVLEGRGGNDILDGKGGSDILDGGAGVDTANYEQNAGRVIVTLRDSADGSATEHIRVGRLDLAISTDTLRNIENVTGTAFKDSITGNGANNRLSGGAGDDTLNGGGGDDTIIGGTETDIEALSGGAGRDTFVYLSRADSFTTATHTGDIILDFNTDEDLLDLRALGVNVANLRLDDSGVGASGRQGHLFEDLNGNNTFDANELNINISLSGSQTFSLQDVLV